MSSRRKEHDQDEQQEGQQATFLAKFTFQVWAVGGVAFLSLLYWVTPQAVVAFEGLQVKAPIVGQWLLDLGAQMHTNQGLLIALGVWAVTLIPFLAGARRGGGAKLYGMLATLACCAIALAWLSLVYSADLISQDFLLGAK